jgi:hypothetical protein
LRRERHIHVPATLVAIEKLNILDRCHYFRDDIIGLLHGSGLVVSGVPDAGAPLGLTPNQQVTNGLACNGKPATLAAPLSDYLSRGKQGLVISNLIDQSSAGGYDTFDSQENDDHNPARVKPRHVFNLGFGTDRLVHAEGT